jgi:hypothetical protein
MKSRAAVAALLFMTGVVSSSAAVRIHDDSGGQIGEYVAKFKAIRSSGERVEIDGTCASACTMLLGSIPRDRICVTPSARLVFHSAWDPDGDPAVAADGNRILWSRYPASVRQWIKRHGGLRSQTITLAWPEVTEMFPTCR